MNEEVDKSIHRIVQIGDSSGIILPKEYLSKQELNRGDKVELFYNDIMKIKPVDDRDIRRELGEASKDEEKRVTRELEAEGELEGENEDEKGRCC